MGVYRTKYFGDITIDEKSDFEFIDAIYKGAEINISISDCNIFGEKLGKCLEMINNYQELDKIAKQAIIDNFKDDGTINYYFECHFDILEEENLLEIFGVDTFEEFNINETVKKLGPPDLLFGINDNEIILSVDYMVSKDYSDEILCVKVDEESHVTGFSHES